LRIKNLDDRKVSILYSLPISSLITAMQPNISKYFILIPPEYHTFLFFETAYRELV